MLYPCNEENIKKAADILRSGGIAAFPTETVYGLGADAFNAKAVARVFEVKRRPRFDPLIVHIADEAGFERVARLPPSGTAAYRYTAALKAAFWPGPLTLVLTKRPEVPALVSAGLDTVAVRFPEHPAAQKLIALSGGAVAAPSANPFGYLSPTRAEHVLEQLGDSVDMILDGGSTSVGVESTVLDITSPHPSILRPGGVSRERLEDALSIRVYESACAEEEGSAVASPGLLSCHYAPRLPLSLIRRGEVFTCRTQDAALIYFNRAEHRGTADGKGSFFLSETGDLAEAAASLFETLHLADSTGKAKIIAEAAPDEGIGRAINDRLVRAARRREDG